MDDQQISGLSKTHSQTDRESREVLCGNWFWLTLGLFWGNRGIAPSVKQAEDCGDED
jgi:hypothetical protein